MLLTYPITLLLALLNCCQSRRSGPYQLLVLLPFSDRQPQNEFRLAKAEVQPVLQMALEDIEAKRILPRGSLLLHYNDTNCSDILGPLLAIEAYKYGTADVFLGPVCPYALAAVARYSSFWGGGIPVITPTGLTDQLDSKNEYKLLIRMVGSYRQLGGFVRKLWDGFSYTRFHMIYHENDNKELGKSECHLAVTAVNNQLKESLDHTVVLNKMNMSGFDENDPKTDYVEKIKEVSMKANGEFLHLICFRWITALTFTLSRFLAAVFHHLSRFTSLIFSCYLFLMNARDRLVHNMLTFPDFFSSFFSDSCVRIT